MMATSSLTHRKAQMELLAEACRRHIDARIAIRHGAGSRLDGAARFLTLDRSAIWFEPATAVLGGDRHDNGPADVTFELNAQRYEFSSRLLGASPAPDNDPTANLRMALPLCVERRPERKSARATFSAAEQVEVTLTPLAAGGRVFKALLANLSDGGLATLVSREDSAELRVAELYWAEFGLPDGRGPIEFAVRLVHRRRVSNTAKEMAGWAFCGTDDGGMTRRRIERVRDCVAARSEHRNE